MVTTPQPVESEICTTCGNTYGYHTEHPLDHLFTSIPQRLKYDVRGDAFLSPDDVGRSFIKLCPICNGAPCTCNVLSPDAPTVTNAEGGSQSLLRVRFDLLDTTAMFRLASILDYGERKYGANNWRKIPTQDHINHALTHIFGYLAGDTQDDHLGHAFCRLMFAIGTEKRKE